MSQFQFTRAARMFISSVNGSVECTKSILMVWVNLKCSVITKQSVEVGRCFRRDRTALYISSVVGMTINGASAIWTASFGLDWTRLTAWLLAAVTSFASTWKIFLLTQHLQNTVHLLWQARGPNTSWVWVVTQVNLKGIRSDIIFVIQERNEKVLTLLFSWQIELVIGYFVPIN